MYFVFYLKSDTKLAHIKLFQTVFSLQIYCITLQNMYIYYLDLYFYIETNADTLRVINKNRHKLFEQLQSQNRKLINTGLQRFFFKIFQSFSKFGNM